MKRLQQLSFLACGVLVLTGCGAEVEGHSISSGLQKGPELGEAERGVVSGGDDDEVVTGAAGAPAEEPMLPRSNGTIYGVADSELTGSVLRAPGSSLSGSVELYCCRAGNYDVYSYAGGRCDDPDSWQVEHSARLASVTCSGDSGQAPYVRDPGDGSTLAVVIYDAAGDAVGCAELAE